MVSQVPVVEAVSQGGMVKVIGRIKKIWLESFLPAPYAEDPNGFDWLAAEIMQPGGIYQIARSGDEVVGFAQGRKRDKSEQPSDWERELVRSVGEPAVGECIYDQVAISCIAVSPEWRGRHLGGALHDGLLQTVRSPRAWLITYPFDCPALTLYRRRGWQLLGSAALGSGGSERLILSRQLDHDCSRDGG
jgi:ribosomal protein S18 acetylase RimI-like enzyme